MKYLILILLVGCRSAVQDELDYINAENRCYELCSKTSVIQELSYKDSTCRCAQYVRKVDLHITE